MKEIKITKNMVVLVDDEDFDLINKFNWQSESHGRTFRAFRAKRIIDDKSLPNKIFMHRFILKAKKGQIIDHIDGNGLNNQRCNLRFCTHSENLFNSTSRKGSSSRFLGVSFDKSKRFNPWVSQIQYQGKNMHIGVYNNEIEAALSYNVAASFMFGSFARLNKTQ